MLCGTHFGKHLIKVDNNLNIELQNLIYKVSHTVIRAALEHEIAEKHDTTSRNFRSLWQEKQGFCACLLEFGQNGFPNGTEDAALSTLLPWIGDNSTDLDSLRHQGKNHYFPTSNKANLNVCMWRGSEGN